MDDINNKISEIKNEINNFYSFVSLYLANQIISDNIRRYFDEITPKLGPLQSLTKLYKICEIIFLVIAEKKGANEEIANTPMMRSTKLGELTKKLDAISHDWYTYCKSNIASQTELDQKIRMCKSADEVCEALDIGKNVFDEINPELYMPTENYVNEKGLPTDAKIVTINVKNTQNLITTTKNIVDINYVKSRYPKLTPTSGVSEDSLSRYSIINVYPDVEPIPTPILAKNDRVFQKIDKDLYRELVNYPKNDYVRNIDYIPINNYVANFENKRIMLMRQSEVSAKDGNQIDDALPGEIRQKFNKQYRSIGEAAFWSLYNPRMSDTEVLKMGIGCNILQNSLPKNAKIIENKFYTYVNKQTLKKLF
jgi:hypothetical protein